jgi:hypothetical protein
MLTIERLKEVLIYDPITGLFTWRITIGQRAQAGKVAGCFDKDGYIVIVFERKKYKAGRLAWFYMTGQWPAYEIDHRDGCRADNVWTNLREATREENVLNSDRELGESGSRGVKFDRCTSSWRARIGRGGQRKWLGPFKTAKEASDAYLAAAELHHGEFALHKRNTGLEDTT